MAFLGLLPDQGTVKLNLDPKDVEREAIGRSLSLFGGTISLIGAALIFSVNPAAKKDVAGVVPLFNKNKTLAIIGAGLGIAALAYIGIAKKMNQRYTKGG
jgi:hypothetical protein